MEIPSVKPRLNESFGWEPVEDGCMIYSMDSSQILTLNAVAELILAYCDGEMNLAAVYESVAADTVLSVEDFMKTVQQLADQTVLWLEPV